MPTLAVIATFTVAEGQADAFEAVARTLVEAVRANEPGAPLYTLARAKREPNVFKMMELYADKDAFKAHGGTTWFQAGFAAMKPLLAADPVIELLDVVA